jgi:hypothetical protein
MSVELSGEYTRGMSVHDDRPLDLLLVLPFEKLPGDSVDCTTWIDPAAIQHVVETLIGFGAGERLGQEHGAEDRPTTG